MRLADPSESQKKTVKPIVTSRAGERLQLDFVGPLKPDTDTSDTYFLLATDCYTKYIRGATFQQQSAEEVVFPFVFIISLETAYDFIRLRISC